MQEPIILTDENFHSVLEGTQPALILFSNGDGLRNEFNMAYKKAAGEHGRVVFARIDPSQNPQAAERFGVSGKPVLIGWYCGDEIVRRPRPWGTDVPLAIEMLDAAVKERNPDMVEEAPEEEKAIEDGKPVIVTDATFEAEVLNHNKPVLVDFWAEWCGPCRMVSPILEKLAKEFAGQIRLAKVNVDENPGLSQAFRIMSIPNIMIVKQKTVIFNQPGALSEPMFRDLIKKAIALEIPPQAAQKQAVK